ncbi:MAG: hypothetical protein VW270_01915 [Candidatus Poseidoniales archaeon]
MNKYSLKEFLKVVESADIIYGTCSLNAAIRIQSRIRKKSLLKELSDAKNVDEFGIYAELQEDRKGRKILKLV